MTMTTSRQTAVSYVTTTRQGGTVPIQAHVIARVVAVLASLMVLTAGFLELVGVRHWAAVTVVAGAATATVAGMLTASRMHKK